MSLGPGASPADEEQAPRARVHRGMRVAAVVLVTGATLAVAEVVLRIRWRATFRPLEGHSWHEYDETLGWRHKRSFSEHVPAGRAVVQAFDVKLNASGVRDPREIPEPKRAGITRIACVGDSFTFGWCVQAEAAFPKQLESRLPRSEVWNWGVAAYGADQVLLHLQRDVLPTKPDLVIASFFDGDFRRATGKLGPGQIPKPRFVLEGDELRLTNVPVPRLAPGESFYRVDAEGSFVLWSLRQAWTKLRTHLASDPIGASEKWRLGRALLRAMKKASREAGARFAFVFLPTAPHQGDEPLERELPALEADGIPVIDATAAFRARLAEHPGELLFIPQDGHPTDAGHALIADVIARGLVERGLLPAR